MIDRRAFLKASGLSVVTFGAGPEFLTRAALAAEEPGHWGRQKTLVTIFQRGAMDALMAVPPLDPASEKVLKKLRPRLAMSAARSAGEGQIVDLESGFGLHPAFGELHSLWKDRRLTIVHAVGSPDPTRSHFDAQDYMETATPGRKGTPSGWLNRAVGELGHEGSPFRAVAMTSAMPRSLYGEQSAVAVTDLASFRVDIPGASRAASVVGQGFEALYGDASQDLLRDAGRDTFEATEMLQRLDVSAYRPARDARYPRSPLGDALKQIAFLVKSKVGLEVAFAESLGWDTHIQQGAQFGSFSQRSQDLAAAIAAFWTDLGSHQDDVVVMTMTEFGRTVRENGSAGTDHGHGSCLFVLGNDVAGGRVHGELPGLDPDVLYEGRDLPVTTDFRSVFSEVAAKHLGVTNRATLFPGWQGEPIPLWRKA